jgi:hypothetical protein
VAAAVGAAVVSAAAVALAGAAAASDDLPFYIQPPKERFTNMNSGRLIGIIMIVVGFGIAIIGGGFLATQVSRGVENGGMSAGGAIVGAGVFFIPIALLVGGGIFMYVKGGQEAEEESLMAKQRQLLDIVKSRGQVGVHEVALEMKVPVDSVKNMVHQLVGLQVFSGFINWDDGTLYSSDASKLRDLKECQKCGAPITLAGKGVFVCKFCGTEYFLA